MEGCSLRRVSRTTPTSIRHNWTRHYKLLAKKIFYTKRQANTRFINLGEQASNASLLDGLDSTSFASS